MFFCDDCENILSLNEDTQGNSLSCYSCDFRLVIETPWQI